VLACGPCSNTCKLMTLSWLWPDQPSTADPKVPGSLPGTDTISGRSPLSCADQDEVTCSPCSMDDTSGFHHNYHNLHTHPTASFPAYSCGTFDCMNTESGMAGNVGTAGKQTLSFIVDSGCVWHVVGRRGLLVNTRPSNDHMYGADGKLKPVECVGYLPIVYHDKDGSQRRLLLTNVRCVPAFSCTLLSTGQLRAPLTVFCRSSLKCIGK
jgi:hypothetical protein